MPLGATTARGSGLPKGFASLTVVETGAGAAPAPVAPSAPAESPVRPVSPVSPATSRAKLAFRARMTRPYGARAAGTTEVAAPRDLVAREAERLRRRAQGGARAVFEREPAEPQRLVAERGDGPPVLGAVAGHRHPEDGDVVARRSAVGDLDGPDQVGRRLAAEAPVVTAPDGGLGEPHAVGAGVVQRELLQDVARSVLGDDRGRSDHLGDGTLVARCLTHQQLEHVHDGHLHPSPGNY